MIKVTFTKWPEFDAFSTFHLLKNSANLDLDKVQKLNLPENIIKIIEDTKDFEDIDSVFIDYFESLYETKREEIDKSILLYQQEWDKINNQFFQNILEITKVNFDIDKFKIYLSPINEGLTNSSEPEIIRYAFEDPKEQTRFTAHEILMYHIWKYLKSEYSIETIKDNYKQFWATNEVLSNSILGLSDLNLLWSENQKGVDDYLKDYTNLANLKIKVKEKYQELSFKDLVKFAIENATYVQTDK